MAAPTRHAMPAADAAWLHMDSDTNPMVVNAISLLGETPAYDDVAEVLERRLVGNFPRFGQRVVEPTGRRPAFEDDPGFDVTNHLHRRALPPPGDRAALEALVSDLIASPIDSTRPLWHVYLIEGHEDGAALLWRIHHCIADGIALSRVMLTITDEAQELGFGNGPPPEHADRGALGRLAGLPGDAISAGRKLGSAAVHEGMETLAHPEHLRELASTAARDASTLARLLTAPADAETSLRGPLSGRRGVAWSRPFALDQVREVSHRRRVTINDTLVTALAATLHETLDAPTGLPEEIHAMIPFNLRPPEEAVESELGNDFALILLELPLGEMNPAERLREVNSRMDKIKHSHEALIAHGMVGALGLTPPWVEDRLIDFFTEKASLVVTNVPGPPMKLHLAGAPIDGVLVWAPCSGTLGMTVSIFSYAGEITTGFMTDTALVADPTPFARAYERQLAALCA